MTATGSIHGIREVTIFDSVATKREIKILQGAEIVNHMGEFLELYRTYQEWPYLYLLNQAEDEQHLMQTYANVAQAIICALFENGKMIGVVMGTPLQHAPDHYKAPFPNNEFSPNTFYLGETLVHPDFRHQGIAKRLFIAFEEQVKNSGLYESIALTMIHRPEDFPFPKPQDAFSFVNFAIKQGYKELGRRDTYWNLICAPDKPPYPNTMVTLTKDIE